MKIGVTSMLLLVPLLSGCAGMIMPAFKAADTGLKMLYEYRKETVCEDHGGLSKVYRTVVTDHRGTGVAGMVACTDGTQFELVSWHYDNNIVREYETLR